MACGDLGMSPSEFWRLTYAELRLVLEGCADRRKREAQFQRHLQAWTASIIVAPHLKEPVTPAMLLGKDSKEKRKDRLVSALAKAAKSKKLIRQTPDAQNLFKRG
jgi:hypothetical protein